MVTPQDFMHRRKSYNYILKSTMSENTSHKNFRVNGHTMRIHTDLYTYRPTEGNMRNQYIAEVSLITIVRKPPLS